MQVTPRILFVDNEVEFLFSANVVMRRAGYRVSVAASGEEALAMALEAEKEGEGFRLLITDIRMPGISGVELIAALRMRNIPLQVLAITGFGDRKLYEDLSARGCSDRIEKPFEPMDLLRKVRKMLNEESSREVMD